MADYPVAENFNYSGAGVGRTQRALEAFGLRGAEIQPAGGTTGTTWRIRHRFGEYALRFVDLASAETYALRAAARAGVPVPRLHADVAVDGVVALLLEWCAGTAAADLLQRDPEAAEAYGVGFGEAQRRLHAVAAPGLLPSAAGWHGVGGDRLPVGSQLLHLDYHPLNVLMDAATVTAILDWTNARRGHPTLDLARTYTLLHVDPSLPHEARAVLVAFAAGWVRGYGPEAGEIPPLCLHWAGRAMLADLAERYRRTPARLDPLRAWTASQKG